MSEELTEDKRLNRAIKIICILSAIMAAIGFVAYVHTINIILAHKIITCIIILYAIFFCLSIIDLGIFIIDELKK